MKKITTIITTTLLIIFIVLFWVKHKNQRVEYTIPDTLIVGTCADFPPLSYKENDEIVGFDIDVINEVAKRLDKRVEIKDMPFDVLIPQLQEGTIHVIAGGLSATIERARYIAFSKPYITQNPLVLLTLKSTSNITDIDNLIQKRVLVNRGYTSDFFISNIKNIFIIRSGSIADALLLLEAHEADAFITQSITADPIIRSKEHFITHTIKNTGENIAFGIGKNSYLLQEKINETLSTMELDGAMESLKQKWHIN